MSILPLELTSETLTIDPNADAYTPSTLQHGLTRDLDGRVRVKPEILAKLSPRLQVRTEALLAQDRKSETNSIAGCRHIQNVTSFCAHNHEAEHAPVICGKPLLHEECATPKSRVSKFEYDSPALHAFLMAGKFRVLTFTIPHTSERTPEKLHRNLVCARQSFAKFIKRVHGRNGWKWLSGFSENFTDTVFYAIHAGTSLPPQPVLEQLWRWESSERGATVRIKTFDGRDGDTQTKGLQLAHSGFVNYWLKVLKDGKLAELAISEAFRGEDLSVLYGFFRGFESAEPQADAEPFLPKCTVCGEFHIRQHMLMTIDELCARFDHIRPTSYGQRKHVRYRIPPTEPTVAPSPPS
jgi:hypothetical protein